MPDETNDRLYSFRASVFSCHSSSNLVPLQARGFTVMPGPQSVQPGAADLASHIAVMAFQEKLERRHHFRITVSATSASMLRLRIAPNSVKVGKALAEQAYRIDLTKDLVTVRAQSRACRCDRHLVHGVAAAIGGGEGLHFLHQVDGVKDHLPDRTTDMRYLVYRELLLPFRKWVKQVRAGRNAYARAHSLPVRNDRFDWKDLKSVAGTETSEISLE